MRGKIPRYFYGGEVMEIIKPESSLNLPPTPTQIRAITRICMAKHIREPLEETPRNRCEARNLIYRLRSKQHGKSGTETKV